MLTDYQLGIQRTAMPFGEGAPRGRFNFLARPHAGAGGGGGGAHAVREPAGGDARRCAAGANDVYFALSSSELNRAKLAGGFNF